jgi:DNA-binding CsgD family transcriptional regulator/tetratricopeptide (TPR) repeat protein
MLFGRERETAQINEVLDDARGKRGGALVIRGEAGIGKSALLSAAIEHAGGMRIFRARGVESEVDIAFSGLHELLLPALSSVDTLPHPQAAALRAALALGPGVVAERLAVFGGALSLLAIMAEERPLLCVIDDAHWLDEASAAAMTFVGRRLGADGVAMLFGAREPEIRSFAAVGIPELRLGGLDRTAARQLLATRLQASAGPLVAERLLEISRGNPLALLELPTGPTASQLTRRWPLDEPFRAGPAVEQGFLRRVGQLPASTRRALLVVAASDVGELPALSRALHVLGLEAQDLKPAERAGLVTLASSVDFCHPLARSAVYGAAEATDRSRAHQALAVAADAAGEFDRRAWHLAATAHAPDEQIASALVGAAESARYRGGVSSEAKALERAALLTPEPRLRAQRLARAGDAAYRAGRLELADALFREAVAGGLELPELAHAQARRAYIQLERGQLDDALELMIGGANDLESTEPRAAATLLTNAATAADHHRLDIPWSLSLAERAWRLAGVEAIGDPELCHIISFQRLSAGRVADAMDLAWRCAELVEKDPNGRIVAADAASTLLYAGEHAAARRLLERAVVANRDCGAIGDLAYTLHIYAQLDWYDGHLHRSYGQSLEAVQIVEELGTPQTLDDCLSRLAMLEAMLGRESDSRGHAQCALRSALRLRDRKNEVRARSALGMLALVTGDPDGAITQLAPAVAALEEGGVGNPNQFRIHPDLVEAYVRLNRTDEARPIVASLERQARATGITWSLGAAMRCRALVADTTSAAEAGFQEALRFHENAGPFERARTELCFGEQLRRRGRRRDSRIHLGAALDAFEASGATPWAERARTELRASGLTSHRRQPAAREHLTPQELQVARLVAEGKTNRDVAAALFITPKTVEFHLTHVYRKLGILSRTELVRRIAGDWPEFDLLAPHDTGSAQPGRPPNPARRP